MDVSVYLAKSAANAAEDKITRVTNLLTHLVMSTHFSMKTIPFEFIRSEIVRKIEQRGDSHVGIYKGCPYFNGYPVEFHIWENVLNETNFALSRRKFDITVKFTTPVDGTPVISANDYIRFDAKLHNTDDDCSFVFQHYFVNAGGFDADLWHTALIGAMNFIHTIAY